MFKDIIGKSKSGPPVIYQQSVYTMFHNTIKTLITVCEANKKVFPPGLLAYDTYALEYGTIKCSSGRQTGKSDYIKKYADKDSLVIVPNAQMMAGYPPGIFEICCAGDVRLIGPSEVFKTIYIDEPTYVFKIASELFIYSILSKNYDQIYIQLGL